MSARTTVAVLTYHSIATQTTPSFAALTVDPSLFAEQLAALREHGLEVIPFGAVPAALDQSRDAVTISIDDGLADAGQNAATALRSQGLPATLFVPSAYVGGSSSWLSGEDGQRAMLSWDALRDLAQDGFEIGSHGHRHIAADLNPPELVRRDAAASRIELEDHLGREVRSFAYPFGYHSALGRRAVRAAGFSQACAVGDLPARSGDDRWALPRLQVWSGTTPEVLLAMVRWRPLGPARVWAHAKQTVWRAGRRWAGWGPVEAQRLDRAWT
jgi:peptidoglycan/xylan/chitin deacetylase (PgdA/CDA1 family)